jgi:cell division protein FtsB
VIQANARSQDKRNAETNATKKEMNDLQQQVKVLTKQMEGLNKKEVA